MSELEVMGESDSVGKRGIGPVHTGLPSVDMKADGRTVASEKVEGTAETVEGPHESSVIGIPSFEDNAVILGDFPD